MKRRDVLRQASVAVAVGAVAGCLSEPGSGGNDDEGTETDSEETNRDRTTERGTTGGNPPEMTARSISTTNTGCRSSDDEEAASVSFGDERVDLTGTISAPTPCHEAAFESARYEGSELVLVVGLASADGVCTECLGIVEYEGSVGFDGEVPETVTVKHRGKEETRTVATASP